MDLTSSSITEGISDSRGVRLWRPRRRHAHAHSAQTAIRNSSGQVCLPRALDPLQSSVTIPMCRPVPTTSTRRDGRCRPTCPAPISFTGWSPTFPPTSAISRPAHSPTVSFLEARGRLRHRWTVGSASTTTRAGLRAIRTWRATTSATTALPAMERQPGAPLHLHRVRARRRHARSPRPVHGRRSTRRPGRSRARARVDHRHVHVESPTHRLGSLYHGIAILGWGAYEL